MWSEGPDEERGPLVAAYRLIGAVPERVSLAAGSYACGVDSFYFPGVSAAGRDVGEDPDRVFYLVDVGEGSGHEDCHVHPGDRLAGSEGSVLEGFDHP
ncbi:MAG: hypothetical protein OXH89_07200 [bacterium]|nr:hypothetical protein [bacterium]